MANIESAKKRARQNEVRRQVNLARKTSVKTAIKKALTALAENTNIHETELLFKDAQAKIARAKNKGLLHKNTAARKMSRLAKRLALTKKK